MGIDWFTFGAQIVNFLILVALLRKFLYGPIVQAMDDREQQITERRREAEQARAAALQEADEFRQRNEQLEQDSQNMLAAARDATAKQKQLWLQEARESVDHNRNAWFEALHREQQALLQEVRRTTGIRAVSIARRALQGFANQELHEHAVEAFLHKLQQLSSTERSEIRAALSANGEDIVVVSAFPLESQTQTRIAQLIQEQLQTEADVTFRQDEELICGIQVRSGGHQVSWSFDDFLDTLDADFSTQITST